MKTAFSHKFGGLRKRIAAGAIVTLAIIFPVAASAANPIKIEANTTVANASKSESWKTSTSASYNQVVDVQVVYNNDETAGSGKVASNLRVKINIPSTAGVNQTITTTTSADNSNTVKGSSKVTLDSANSYLQYIPGTAIWKHAVSANSSKTTTQKVSDAVVTAANGLVLENENPCQAGSVQVQARVMTPGLSVDKYVRETGTTNWTTSVTAKAGDTVQYEIAYHNTGNTSESDVEFRDQLPKGITYVAGSSLLKDSNHPNGATISPDTLTTDGIITGSYAPGAAGYVMFDAKVADADKLACGNNLMRNIAYVQPKGMNYYYNTADVNVNKDCTPPPPPATPKYSCDALTLTSDNDSRTVKISGFKTTASGGATFTNAAIAWGDSNGATFASPVGQSHTYSADGTYTVTATAQFTVNGKDVTATSAGCAKSVTFKTTPPPPPATPKYSCDAFALTADNSTRTVTVSKFAYTATGGATFNNAVISWGDNSDALTTNNVLGQTHKYAADGSYTVSAVAHFTVNGKDVTDSGKCSQTVSFKTTPPPKTIQVCELDTKKVVTINEADFNSAKYTKDLTKCQATPPVTPPTTPPTELVNTGAGNLIGFFGAVTLAGGLTHRLFLSRRLSRG